MRKSDTSLIAMVVGVFVAMFIVVAVVACNPDGASPSGGGYYPHDTSHGYYDSHHHYHYYHKYGSGRKAPRVAPRGRSSVRRGSSGGSGFSKSGRRR
jgi:hypothetical protein